ncbi:oligopeptide/dipeptide ABC transporter ATP-binding protein [Vineibacter terrae]|uniref:ABC transporter ATP-binding protein n=1 Tax=Vineibacter terrae TaxID=2586908 RepID=UPI002E30E7F3|nr:oligopeptide/dipeptide ABC transporter ATP-binding protein [Vineibacter terrae]HEX2886270.1 oligopeptide/dipeptide ABC transporter ATP-binding protein [Vineibacter terrae]
MPQDASCPAEAVLDVAGLAKSFTVARSWLGRGKTSLRAVDGVDFSIRRGETLSLVGESGSGKSTLARLCLKLIEPTAGRIQLFGRSIERLPPRAMRPLRRNLQMVFQDPFASLNPRLTVGQILGEPIRNFRIAPEADIAARVEALLARVGLPADVVSRRAHEFSGGQRQRIGIARALAPEPQLIVLDEPVSALDVSVQAQVLNLLGDLQAQAGYAYLFVSHDLAVVRHISHRVAVMYLGRIVEIGPVERLFSAPRHPYTEALLAAVPDPGTRQRAGTRRRGTGLLGEIPSPIDPPSGCAFRTRCPLATERCARERPALMAGKDGHAVACHVRQA